MNPRARMRWTARHAPRLNLIAWRFDGPARVLVYRLLLHFVPSVGFVRYDLLPVETTVYHRPALRPRLALRRSA